MALGGGTYLVQNKVLPGAYINFVSKPRAMGSLSERGILCVGLEMDWGTEGMMSIEAADFQRGLCKEVLGYGYEHENMKVLREALIGAKEVKLFRLNGGETAKAVIGGLSVKAKCSGARGNDIRVAIAQSIDEDDKFDAILCSTASMF